MARTRTARTARRKLRSRPPSTGSETEPRISPPGVCLDCGRMVPAHIKHVPSRRTDGPSFAGTSPCRWLAIDKDGRTWREKVGWQKLGRAATGRRST